MHKSIARVSILVYKSDIPTTLCVTNCAPRRPISPKSSFAVRQSRYACSAASSLGYAAVISLQIAYSHQLLSCAAHTATEQCSCHPPNDLTLVINLF